MRKIRIEKMKGGMLMMGFMSLMLLACQPKSEYQKVKERELASGKVVEDLFLDLRFGMGRKQFYGTCWELNKKGILTNGAHHLQVQYKPSMPSGKEALMHFYPQFEDNQLFFMPMEFNYPSWFPGNEEYSNDKLLEDVLGLLTGWYGEGFFEVSNKEKTITAFVKIDGNRLIRVFKKDLTSVRVEMLDLRVRDISEMNKKDEAA
ncbi:hypothetical protein [Cecembia calidifontis]|uniref:Lipoprotein n=1 Tax=Cecembia calidifontis TaxID=1187080 RepID=A0A4Q7P8T9_9BACT|nr:hypothetical protein [Cecembia calidifontis]RZS95978.1 hypothetical protein BC751_1532 [Cecembia calidifontis]